MKNIFLLVFLTVFQLHSFAQDNEGNATQYTNSGIVEKILIQTNQLIYSKGENIWIRCNLIDGVSNIPSTSAAYPKDRSKFIYVELHDCQLDTLVCRHMIKSDSLGVFCNAIEIPNDIKEGYYMLVAYTQRMTNFSEKDFGYKEIYITGAIGGYRNVDEESSKRAATQCE